MQTRKEELAIPPAAQKARKAIELLRVWAANGKQHVTLAADVWDDPAAWGIMLVDLAKHVANAYAQKQEITYADALARIKEGLDSEWNDATDEPTGQIED